MLVSLLLSIKDAYNCLLAEVIVISGDLNDRNNKGTFHIKYGIFEAGVPAPTDPSQLSEYILTKCKKDIYKLPYNSSGKMAYFCVRIENGDRKGEWGPIIGARIP